MQQQNPGSPSQYDTIPADSRLIEQPRAPKRQMQMQDARVVVRKTNGPGFAQHPADIGGRGAAAGGLGNIDSQTAFRNIMNGFTSNAAAGDGAGAWNATIDAFPRAQYVGWIPPPVEHPSVDPEHRPYTNPNPEENAGFPCDMANLIDTMAGTAVSTWTDLAGFTEPVMMEVSQESESQDSQNSLGSY